MALKPCRECQKQVSTEAKQCPHCGVNRPIPHGSRKIQGVVALAAGLFAVWMFSSITPSTSSGTPAAPETPAEAKVRLCKSDWHQCDDNEQMANNWNGWSQLKGECKRSAEKIAKYGDPKWPWFPFGSFLVGKSYLAGKATVIEDDAQFQNAFGASVHTEVRCIYDLNLKSVVDVFLVPR